MLPLPTNLGGTSVTITDRSGVKAMFYTGATRINAEIRQTARVGREWGAGPDRSPDVIRGT